MSAVKQYRKKPVVIEAAYYDGHNAHEIILWAGGDIEEFGDGRLRVVTLEGDHIIDVDYYVIKGVEGEFYGCEPGIFGKTYDELA